MASGSVVLTESNSSSPSDESVSEPLHQRFISNLLHRGRVQASIYECRMLEPYLEDGAVILDIGCGKGFMIDYVQRTSGAKVIAIDIEDSREVDVTNFCIFDGMSLPFANKSVEYIIISFVLHHTQNKDELLREALRVVSKRVFIFEDVPENLLDHLLMPVHGMVFNKVYKVYDTASFLSLHGWMDLFDDVRDDFWTVKAVDVPYWSFQWYFPITRKLFILDYCNAGNSSQSHSWHEGL